MRPAERLWRIGSDVAGVLPRTRTAVSSQGDWNPLSAGGARAFGEVLLDELALTGMTLTAPPPKVERSIQSCAAAAAQLAGAGVAGAHTAPEPLRVRSIRRLRFGRTDYERLSFVHDPHLPDVWCDDGFGRPATAVVHLMRTEGVRRPWLVWVHGAGQGTPIDLVVSRARHIRDRLGVNVALPVQPGCGVRRTAPPAYPTMDPLNNVAQMMRAVSEVRALVRWLRPQADALAVAGVSMGSPVAGLVAHLEPVDAVALYTPIFGLNAMIAAHLGRWGPSVQGTVELLGSEPVAELTSAVDYMSVEPSAPLQRRLVVGAWQDQMARREPAIAVHRRWGGELYWHPGSHVGHLWAGGVRKITDSFLQVLNELPGGGAR
ncbi:alpha/beta hydrolase [Mycolicibacterium sp. S2-37]|uniref:alpha/beta fold hydrolase n=1 Tax=Mycolicibacterium sp. S2-37 TaxID=2810297 RepID=UPI001A93BCE4|nr:alpha/beta hydrolase [Mycolicibacterium sp. S2-37]MBO0677430.1 alpha/beta hydrolase [Mycolicibacterium sp. S2-37]